MTTAHVPSALGWLVSALVGTTPNCPTSENDQATNTEIMENVSLHVQVIIINTTIPQHVFLLFLPNTGPGSHSGALGS